MRVAAKELNPRRKYIFVTGTPRHKAFTDVNRAERLADALVQLTGGEPTYEARLVLVVVALGILYLGDFLSVRFRIPARDTFGSVTVHTLYVVG